MKHQTAFISRCLGTRAHCLIVSYGSCATRPSCRDIRITNARKPGQLIARYMLSPTSRLRVCPSVICIACFTFMRVRGEAADAINLGFLTAETYVRRNVITSNVSQGQSFESNVQFSTSLSPPFTGQVCTSTA